MSELYELPDGWEWKKLEDLAKFQSGGTPSRSNKSYWDNGNIHWVKISDINDNMYVSDTKEFITKDGLDNSSAKLFPKGTILYTIFATIGKIGILNIEATTNQAISGIQPKDNVDLFYMYYGLKFITDEIKKVSVGVAQNNINLTKLKEQDFPLPPLSEQQRIVSKLDLLFEKIDKSIALHQKNMDEANAFMGSVLNDVFGELEGKYEKKELKDLVSKLGDGLHGTPKYDENGEYYFINGANVKDNKIVINENTKKVNEEEYLKYKKELTDRTVFVSINGTIGNVGLYNNEKCMLGKSACYFNLLEDIDKIYITYVIQNGEFQQYIEENSTGATIKNVSLKTMRAYKVVLPPLNIQQKVVKYLDEISQKIEKIKQAQKTKMNSLKALKASILDQAFKGEL